MTLAFKYPDNLPLGFDLVRVHAHIDVPEQLFTTIRERVGFKGDDSHGNLGQMIEVAGMPLALTGQIGLHDYRKEKSPGRTGFMAHYSLELEAGVEIEDPSDSEWEKHCDVVAELLIEPHPCAARLQQFLPKDGVVPATSLPIQLGDSGIAGFSEIRGVRLVQPDPTNEKRALYSVVFELVGGERYSVGTMTTIETRFDADVLVNALTRLGQISGLAYKEGVTS